MSEDEKDDKDDKSDKPLFIVRAFAYIFDFFLVLLVSCFIAAPFVNTNTMNSLAQESREMNQKYHNKELTDQEYLVEASNIEYAMAESTELIFIIVIFVGVIYYVVLPIFNNGQTFGKKITKLKIISTVGDLNSNQLIFRSFLANFILLYILYVLFVMFASREVFLGCVELFSFAQYTLTFASIIMVVFGKEGLALHDQLVHTKVIKVK